MVQQSSRFSVGKVKLYHHLVLAGLMRAGLIVVGEWQDQNLQLKYTDVDYHVFTDGAAYVVKGESPFLRETYRYSPLLAVLLVPQRAASSGLRKSPLLRDSILALIVVFSLFALLKNRDTAAGLAYGFSVHLKMYTAVYALPIYLALQTRLPSGSAAKGELESWRSYLSRTTVAQ
ncbi:hypothetical protein MRX96_020966 [Rhipicephalus microplus]